jgi:hypothetical protein
VLGAAGMVVGVEVGVHMSSSGHSVSTLDTLTIYRDALDNEGLR